VHPPTMLVIEDSRDQALLFGAAARRARPGLEIRHACDGQEGISYLAGQPPYDDRTASPTPDLVLLDLLMPGVDGFEVLTWMRDEPDAPRVPVVVFTASADPRDRERALALGAAAVYAKPTGIDGLGSAIREIVERWIGRGEMIGAHLWTSG